MEMSEEMRAMFAKKVLKEYKSRFINPFMSSVPAVRALGPGPSFERIFDEPKGGIQVEPDLSAISVGDWKHRGNCRRNGGKWRGNA
jgi:hypothetical protein